MFETENINRTRTMFLAHIKQVGEGCDYTIACGEKVVRLKAISMADAREEVRRMLAEDYTFKGDRRLQSATVYEVHDTFKVPVDAWYDELRAESTQDEAQRQQAARRRQYETLKHEFGGQ